MSALGYDPVPGDVYAVQRVASLLGGVACQAESITTRLRKLDGGSGPQVWRGPAADAFRSLLGDVGPDVIQLAGAHREAEDALRFYAGMLGSAQDTGRQAENDAAYGIADRDRARCERDRAAADAQADEATARTCRVRLWQATAARAAAPFDPAFQDAMTQYESEIRGTEYQAETRAAQARGREDTARAAEAAGEARVQAAHLLAGQAKELRDGAARRVVDRLDAAGQLGIARKNPISLLWSLADDTLRGIATNPAFLEFLGDLDKVNGVLALAGGIAMLIPGLQPVGAVLLGASAVLGVVSLAGTILAARYGGRRASDVAWGVLGLIPGLKTAKGLPSGVRGLVTGRLSTIKRALSYADGRKAPVLRHVPIAPKITGLERVVLRHGRIDPRVYYGSRVVLEAVNNGKQLYEHVQTARPVLAPGLRVLKPIPALTAERIPRLFMAPGRDPQEVCP